MDKYVSVERRCFNTDGAFLSGVTVQDYECFQRMAKSFISPNKVKMGDYLPRPMRLTKGKYYYSYVDYLYDGKHWHFVGDLRPMLKPDKHKPEDFENVIQQAKAREKIRAKKRAITSRKNDFTEIKLDRVKRYMEPSQVPPPP